MKIKLKKLAQQIKNESSDIEVWSEEEYEGRMAKGNLYNIVKSAKMLHDIIEDNQNLEPWVEEKIAVAAESIKTVAEYMEYEKARGD